MAMAMRLPRAIDDDIRAGRTVVANVSRTVIEAMRRAYAEVVVVSITAPAEVLAERLAARARGSDGQIEGRLAARSTRPRPRRTSPSSMSAASNITRASCVRIIRGD